MYVCALLVVCLLVDVATSEPYVANVRITSGNTISRLDPLKVSAELGGYYRPFLDNDTLAFQVHLKEKIPLGVDRIIGEWTVVHIRERDLISGTNTVYLSERDKRELRVDDARASYLMSNLDGVEINRLSESSEYYAEVRARYTDFSYWNQKYIRLLTDWGRSANTRIEVIDPPKPIISSGSLPSNEISLNTEFIIGLSAFNASTTSSETYITVSMSDGLEFRGRNVKSGSVVSVRLYKKGETITHRNFNRIPAEYDLVDILVKPFTSDEVLVDLKFKATKLGTQEIKYRATSDTPAEGYRFVNDPTEGELDQQGWETKKKLIYVVEQTRGTLVVKTSPIEGKIAVDRGEASGGGYTFEGFVGQDGEWSDIVPSGIYVITFLDIEGYQSPESKAVIVGANQTTEVEGIYTKEEVPPNISDVPDRKIIEGNSYSEILQATGTAPIRWSLTRSPHQVSIDNTTGQISWQSPSVGTYTITIRAENIVGYNDKTWTLTVNPKPSGGASSPPTANFAANPTLGLKPLTVIFTDQSQGTINSWLWDFGDGGQSTTQNTTHTYNSSGIFSARLTITGSGGSNSKTQTITVTEPDSTIEIAITTYPFGLNTVVDNTLYRGAVIFHWKIGSPHTISAPSPQVFQNGDQLFFASWSDGGNRAHRIVVSSIDTLTAIFKGETVSFSDSYLETAIRAALNKPEGDLTTTDFYGYPDLDVMAIGEGITSLNGIEKCRNIEQLNLADNQITDISQLSSLVGLRYLNLSNNEITDIIPLSGLENLEYLALNDNNISDISALSNLKNIFSLSLRNNSISDISPLSNLKNLNNLFLLNNKVRDISPLSQLSGLGFLELGSNEISDISPLENVSPGWIGLQDNQIQDISPLVRNSGINSDNDVVILNGNPLSTESIEIHIPELVKRNNVQVRYDRLIRVGTDPVGLRFSADGIEYSAEQDFQWGIAQWHTLSVSSPQQPSDGIRYMFSFWNGLGSNQENSIFVFSLSPDSYIAVFETQYYLGINSERGSPNGHGWYGEGRRAEWSVISPIHEDDGIRYVADSASGSVVMNEPKTINVFWKKQYYLNTNVVPGNSGSITSTLPGQWIDEGTTVTITATSAEGKLFSGWSGDLISTANPAEITMDKPKTITAVFEQIQDDDTTGPSFSNFLPGSTLENTTFKIKCDIQDPSDIFDDNTGSNGQGVYLKWDNDGELINSTKEEVQMRLFSGNTYQTDTDIPGQVAGVNFIYQVYAYDNDFDNNDPKDRTQNSSPQRAVRIYRGNTPPNLPPPPPNNLRAIRGDRQITLTWNANTEGDFLRYRIYGGTTSNPITLIDSIGGVSTTTSVIRSIVPLPDQFNIINMGLFYLDTREIIAERFTELFGRIPTSNELNILFGGGTLNRLEIAPILNDLTYYFSITAVDSALQESDPDTVIVPPINHPPEIVNAISDTTLMENSLSFVRNLDGHPKVFRDPDGDPLTYTATSSNSTIATASISGTILTVTPISEGNAIITVSANDNKGGNARDEFRVTVNKVNKPPEAKFTVSKNNVLIGEMVNFIDSSEGVIISREWNFGDGNTSNEINLSHEYEEVRAYTVSLIVRGPGGVDTTTTVITVSELLPVADFTTSQKEGTLEVLFQDTSQEKVLSWRWDFGEQGNNSTSTEGNPSHTYRKAGTYTVSLTVSNTAGSDTKAQLIVVKDIGIPEPDKPIVLPEAYVNTPDIDGDGSVIDFDDFFMFADDFGKEGELIRADLDGDGVVSFDDFFLFADVFGKEVVMNQDDLVGFPRYTRTNLLTNNIANTIAWGVDAKKGKFLMITREINQLEVINFENQTFKRSNFNISIDDNIRSLTIDGTDSSGTSDLIIGTNSGKIYIISDFDNIYNIKQVADLKGSIAKMVVGQLSEDQLPDICVGVDAPLGANQVSIHILRQNINGTFHDINIDAVFYEKVGFRSEIDAWANYIGDITLADLNGDDRLDIAASVFGYLPTGEGVVYRTSVFSPDNQWHFPQRDIRWETKFTSLKTIDIENNGKIDLVATGSSELNALKNRENNVFEFSKIDDWEDDYNFGKIILSSDFNFDNKTDLVVGGFMENLRGYINMYGYNSESDFLYYNIANVQSPVQELISADIDNDNVLDIVILDGSGLYLLHSGSLSEIF